MSGGLVVSSVWKSWGSFTAVAGVDLEAAPGEFVTLLGASGSGKTTTLRIIAGLAQPDEGTITIGGRAVNGPGVSVPSHQRGLGMVFQSYAVWPHMTVADNVGFPLKVRGVSRGERKERVSNTLATVSLSGLERRYPSTLSGGQQQRVALARAIVGDPEVILYDEPLSNLDAKLRERMRFEIRSLHDRLDITAVYVTHDQQEAMALSDRIYLMSEGQVIQSGTPRELFDTPSTASVADFIGQANLLPVSSQRNATCVEIADGLIVRIRPAADGSSANSVVIRPHHLMIAKGDTSGLEHQNCFPALVRQSVFLGDHVRLTTTIANGIELRADVPPSVELPAVGDEVTLYARQEDCVLV